PVSLSWKVIVVLALAVNVPSTVLLIVTVQVRVLPLPEGVAHVSDWVNFNGSTLVVTVGVIVKAVIEVPDGIAVAVIVKTWVLFTSLTALGRTSMAASTNRLVTLELLPFVPSVSRWKVVPPKVRSTEAW